MRRSNTPRGRRIVQANVEMGCTLGFRVVVWGIEDQITQAMLAALGVHKLQGLVTPPMDTKVRETEQALPNGQYVRQ